MNRGDVYSVDLDPTRGTEQAGRRPVLVISASEFNQRTAPVVLPITRGGNFTRVAGFTVPLAGCGATTEGVILCHQPRTVDIRARNGRFVETLPQPIVDDAVARLAAIIEVD